MDYYKIGQQVRKIRKAKGFSQEELAELVNISTTHMSHIETGNTKLSLPVLVDIAGALQVRTDELLYGVPEGDAGNAMAEIAAVLRQCTDREAKVIAEVVRATKLSMDKHL